MAFIIYTEALFSNIRGSICLYNSVFITLLIDIYFEIYNEEEQ